MAPKNFPGGGPAFPLPVSWEHPGMSLRDYYAGQVIDTLLTRAANNQAIEPEDEIGWAVDKAWEVADAMIGGE